MAIRLGTVAEELAKAEARLAGAKVGDACFCIHHNKPIERLTEPPSARLACIMKVKAKDEPEWNIAVRLHCFRPVDEIVLADAAWQQADAARLQADAARQEENAAWQKAYTAWRKAYAARRKADTAWQQADTAWRKAYAARQQADAVWQQADAAWQQASIPHFERVFGVPWEDDIFSSFQPFLEGV